MSAVAERKISDRKNSAKHIPPNGLVLRSIVFKSQSNAYTAECIDLDILVYGKTQHEALHSLREAIFGYLQVAFSGDPSGLVPRRAPLSHRLRYHLFALRAALTAGATRSFLLSDCSPGPTLCDSRL